MPEHRRRSTPEQKAAVVREHWIDRVPVSDLCDKHGIQPTVFYRRQKRMFENPPALFKRGHESASNGLVRENQARGRRKARAESPTPDAAVVAA